MKILVVHEVSYKKKVVYEYQDFAERLAKRGHQVTVIDFDETSDGKNKEIFFSKTGLAEIRLISTPFYNKPVLKFITARINFKKLLEPRLKAKEFDVVFLYSVFINGTNTVRLCKKYDVPVIYRLLDIYHKLRGDLKIMIPLYFGEKFIYKNADYVCLTNEVMSKYVEKMAGKRMDKQLRVLHHGVDTDFFQPVKKNSLLLDKFNFSIDDKIIVFVGTIYTFSGLDVLLKAFPDLKKQIPRLKFIIVGGGDLEPELKNLVNNLFLEKEVILTGFRSYEEVPNLISCADVTVLPFFINDVTRDIIPIKVLQYLACKKPVVAAPLPDLMRMFPEKQSGIIYQAIENGPEFIAQLRKILIDNEFCNELSENAYQYIQQNFKIDLQINKLEKLLTEAVDCSTTKIQK